MHGQLLTTYAKAYFIKMLKFIEENKDNFISEGK